MGLFNRRPAARQDSISIEQFSTRYYLLAGGQARGPYRADELRKIPGFTLQTPLRTSTSGEWKPAFTVIDLRAYFASASPPPLPLEKHRLLEQEKSRQRWQRRRNSLKRTVDNLIHAVINLVITLALAAAMIYGGYRWGISPSQWRRTALPTLHTVIQRTISQLSRIDHLYFNGNSDPHKRKK